MPNPGFSVCPHCGWRPGDAPANPLYLPPGTTLNAPYQVARVLGHGGFGITYLGWDANLQIKVAIKEYLPRDFASRDPLSGQVFAYAGDARQLFESGLAGFLDEARTLAKFQQHPGIVSVLAFFRAFGTGYMVMEYVEGETLKSYLQQHLGRLNWMQTLAIFMQVMDALRAVHRQGLLHRDVAPDNIYLCTDGRIKLLDFGAARLAVGARGRTLSVVVKPGFAPEEQYREGAQGPWSDVYSVAASIYFCLTGQAPPDALERLDRDQLKPPSHFGVSISPFAEQALLEALAVKAERRIQTMEELQQRLSGQSAPSFDAASAHSNGNGSTDVEPRPSSFTEATPSLQFPNISRFRRWLTALLAMLLIGLVYALLRPGKPDAPKIHQAPAATGNSADQSPSELDEDVDWMRQRELERIAAEELRRQQEAALRRFDERERRESIQSPPPISPQDPRQQEHLRSLCDEWGATMDCRGDRQ